jgi:hypothetical protein
MLTGLFVAIALGVVTGLYPKRGVLGLFAVPSIEIALGLTLAYLIPKSVFHGLAPYRLETIMVVIAVSCMVVMVLSAR